MKNIFKKFSREIGILAVLVVMMAIFGTIEPIYLTSGNLLDILDQTVINGLIAVGMTIVIITGGIDISVGSTMAVVLVLVGNLTIGGMNPFIAVIIGMIIGASLGAINGFLISKMHIQPFVATMGTMSIYRGVAYVITGGWPVLNIPPSFRSLMDGNIVEGVSISVLTFIIMAIIATILLKQTRFGTYLYSVGNNEEATKLSGVNVSKTKIFAYSFCGICTSLAAMVMLAKLGTGEPAAGDGYELDAIAAVAIGGTSLAGGKGSILGTFIGALLLQSLKVGLIVCRVDTFWQYIASGTIILVAVYFDLVKDKISAKIKKGA